MRRIKIFIRGLLAPVLGFSLRKDWTTAKADSAGYESSSTLKDLALRVREIQFLNSRNHDPRIEIVLTTIKNLLATIPENQVVKILDVGGSFGEYFFYTKQAINTHTFEWTVLETEGHCSIVPASLKSESGLNFVSRLEKNDSQFNVALLSSVIQYVEEPYALLEFACSKADSVILNRLPLSSFDTDKVAVQRPGLFNSKGSYPVHIFSEKYFLSRVNSFGEITSRWMVPQDSAVIRFKYVENQGMLLKPLHPRTV